MQPLLARAAGVHERRTDPPCRLRRRLAKEGERDLAALWTRIVERHQQRPALEATPAVGPCDLRWRRRRGWAARCFGRVERAGREKDRDEHQDLCSATRHGLSLLEAALAGPV